MSKTKRRQPMRQESRNERLEREWERQVSSMEQKTRKRADIVQHDRPIMLPPHVEAIRQEAEAIINAKSEPAIVERASRVPFSVQSPSDETPREAGGGLVWWTGGRLDQYIPVAEYGDPSRDKDLRMFALIAPLILNGEAILTKKVQALQWTIEGGRNLAQKWQKRLNNFENGDGWDYFIARWIRSYSESDKPAYVELIRAFPSWAVGDDFQLTPRGQNALEKGKDAAWEIVDARVMDPVQCNPTTSSEFPLAYRNPHTGLKFFLRPYQFMSLIDQPGVDDKFPGLGVCAVSRAVWAAQEDRMVIRFAMEKMSENPGAGLGIINANIDGLRTALEEAKAEREARGVVYYKGVIFIPMLNPTGTQTLEFLSFADLPDGFNRSETYNIMKEVVATAFGLDLLEFGSIPGRLGTATQAKIAAAKGRTRSMGSIMQGIERSFRYKLLPEAVSFNIKKHDQEEEMQRATIDAIYFENAIRYAQFQDPLVANQYLVDKGAVPNEPPYTDFDLTPKEEVLDTQSTEEEGEGSTKPEATSSEAIAEGPEGAAQEDIVKRWKHYGPRIRLDRDGRHVWTEPLYMAIQMRRLRHSLLPSRAPRIPATLHFHRHEAPEKTPISETN